VEKYRNQYGSGLEALTYLGQNYLSVDPVAHSRHFAAACARTSSSTTGVDVTAAHYPKRGKAIRRDLDPLFFCARNERMRVKTQIADGGFDCVGGLNLADGELAGAGSL